ncbi:MAG: fibronectin type III domain-containing protein [Ignavibacteriaceae bacterium]|nr:fibronectin type III domain-containing protein [Ignavibacteriaceae bacterium]
MKSDHNYSIFETIYGSGEIGREGTIERIAFGRNSYNGDHNYDNIKVYLKQVNAGSYPDNQPLDTSGFTLVYDGPYSSTEGWNWIPFTKHFYYNAQQNLGVLIIKSDSIGHGEANWYVNPSSTSKYSRSNHSNVSIPTSFAYTRNKRPSVLMLFRSSPTPPVLVSPLNNSVGLWNPISVKWEKSGGASRYWLQVSSDSLFLSQSTDIMVVNDSMVTDTTFLLPPETFYDGTKKIFWRVKAVNSLGATEWSPTYRFTIVGNPSVPEIARLVSPYNNSKGLVNPVDLKWRKSKRAEKYIIEIARDSLFSNIHKVDSVLAADTTYSINLPDYGITYYWRVKAKNISGEASAEVFKFKMLGNSYPVTLISPANASTQQPPSGLLLKWSKPVERIESILGYQLQVSVDSSFGVIDINDSTLTDTTKLVNGLDFPRKHFWRVRAKNLAGWGDWSAVWSFSTKIAIPHPPVLLRPQNYSTELWRPIDVYWRKISGANRYWIQVSNDSLFRNQYPLTVIVDDSMFTDTVKRMPDDLFWASGKTYYWRVKAMNELGSGEWSQVFRFTTRTQPAAPQLISPPNGVMGQPTSGVTLLWNSVIAGGTGYIVNYELEVATTPNFTWGTFVFQQFVSGTIRGLNNLAPQKKYYWRVRAWDEITNGIWSEVRSFTTMPTSLPPAPVPAWPQSNVNEMPLTVSLIWRSVPADNYQFQVATDSTFSSSIRNDSTIVDTTFLLTNLSGYTKYYWRVRATNLLGTSNWSQVFNFKTIGVPYAGTLVLPANNSVNVSPRNLIFKWTKPRERIEAIQRYQLQISYDSLFTTAVFDNSSIPDTMRTVNTILYGMNYFWRVRALNGAGWGDWSAYSRFSTVENIKITAPVGGDTLLSEKNYEIKWLPSIADTVRIEHSLDGGLTWQIISANYPAQSGKFIWRVPTVKTAAGLIRIQATNNPDLIALSPGVFRIISSRPEITPAAAGEPVYDPPSGSNATVFRFKVMYQSDENKPPRIGFPRVVLDFDGDGVIEYGEGEGAFTMMEANRLDLNYADGKIFILEKNLPVGNNHRLKFESVDTDGDTSSGSQQLLNYFAGPNVRTLPNISLFSDDLIITSSNNTVGMPTKIKFFWRVSPSNQPITEDVKFGLYVDGNVVDEVVFAGLYSHTGEHTFTYTPHSAGVRIITVKADVLNAVEESVEWDNEAGTTVSIGPNQVNLNITQTGGGDPVPFTGMPNTGFDITGTSYYLGISNKLELNDTLKVKGGRVTVAVNGKNYVGYTNSDGKYSVNIPGLPSGSYPYSAVISDNFLSGTVFGDVDILNPNAGGGNNQFKDVSLSDLNFSKTNPVSGENTIISVKTSNTGTETLSNVPVFLYVNNILRDSSVTGVLQQGDQQLLTFTLNVQTTGANEIRIVADPRNQIEEINKNNNFRNGIITVEPLLPDLVVSDVSYPAILKINRPFIIRARIKNTGNSPVSTPFSVIFQAGGQNFGPILIQQLGAGIETEVEQSVTLSQQGNIVISALVDSENQISEDSELNNRFARIAEIKPLLPNLVLKPGSLTLVPPRPGAADSIKFSVSVKNEGEVNSQTSELEFSVNGTQFKTVIQVSGLNAGEETVIQSVTPFISGMQSAFTALARIDFLTNQAELSKSDNIASTEFVTGSGSDLAIDSSGSIVPDILFVKAGQQVNLKALIRNAGEVVTSGKVEFYSINSVMQRSLIKTVPIQLNPGESNFTGIIPFIVPALPVTVSAKIVNTQPQDVNLTNNENVRSFGDIPPVIAGLDSVSFKEDSMLVLNLDNYVTDPGDSLNTLTWSVVSNGNILVSLDQQTRLLELKAPPDYYGTDSIRISVSEIGGSVISKSVFVKVDPVIDYPGVPQPLFPLSGTRGLISPVTLTWNKSIKTESYRLQLSSDSLFSTLIINDSLITDTSKIITSVSGFTQYYWRVKGINQEAVGDWSAVFNFKTLGNPYASNPVTPVNNSVNQPINTLTFMWTKAKERIETIQRYQYQLANDTSFASIVVNDTTLTDTMRTVSNLDYLTNYHWRVRASNETGWGDWSESWSFTTIIEKPALPLLAQPGNNSTMQIQPVTVSWNKSARSEKYTLQVSDNPAFATLIVNDTTLGSGDTSRALPQLVSPQTYHWRVKARNTGGESDYSAVWNFRTLGLPLTVTPVQPAENSVNQPTASLSFIWRKAGEQTLITSKGAGSKKQSRGDGEEETSVSRNSSSAKGARMNGSSGSVTEGGENILRYWLQVSNDTSGSNFFFNDSTLTDTVKNLSGLAYSTDYYWRVKAQNETGWGGYSQWIKFRTIVQKPGVVVLAAPQNNAQGLVNPVTSTWNKSLRAEGYKLQVSADSLFATTLVNDSTITDTSKILPALANFTRYYWRVKAYNVGGEGEWSSEFSFRTLGNPYASNLVSPANQSVNQPVNGLVFKWNKPAERREDLLGYHYQLSSDSLFAATVINDTTLADTIVTVNDLTNLTTYYWRVRAKNQAGWGDWSDKWSLKTIVSSPGQVTLVSPANNSTDQALRPQFGWNRIQVAERYRFELAADQNFQNIVVLDSVMSDTARSLTSDLNWNTKYYWRVKAVNVGGAGSYSAIFNFTTKKQPVAAPTNLQAIWLASGRVRLHWNDNSSNEAGFILSRKTGDTLSANQFVILTTLDSGATEAFDSTALQTTLYTYMITAYTIDSMYANSNMAVIQTGTGVNDELAGRPTEYRLHQNYPNPFNPGTTIQYQIPEAGFVTLKVYDLLGNEVAELVNAEKEPGYYEVKFNADKLASGVYLYKLQAGSFSQTKKFSLLK